LAESVAFRHLRCLYQEPHTVLATPYRIIASNVPAAPCARRSSLLSRR
jgi:hypothetical protein